MLDSKSEIISFVNDVNNVSFLVKQELTMLTKVIALTVSIQIYMVVSDIEDVPYALFLHRNYSVI